MFELEPGRDHVIFGRAETWTRFSLRKMTSTLATWNVQTIHATDKLEEVQLEMERYRWMHLASQKRGGQEPRKQFSIVVTSCGGQVTRLRVLRELASWRRRKQCHQ